MGKLNSKQKAHLLESYGTRISLDKTERKLYGHDIAVIPNLVKPLVGDTTPEAVVQPETEDELIERQDEDAQKECDGHRSDKGYVEVELPRKRAFLRSQVAQEAHQENQYFNRNDEPEVIDEKTFQFHPVEKGGQSGLFIFFFGAHLNSQLWLQGDVSASTGNPF